MNSFTVKKDYTQTFENRWRNRESHLGNFRGFIRFYILKGSPVADKTSVEYISHTTWLDEECFLTWLHSDSFKQSHQQNSDVSPTIKDMLESAPEFKSYSAVIDEVPGTRVDARSMYMDRKIEAHFAPMPTGFEDILTESKKAGLPPINIGAFEGKLIEIILRAAGAKRGVEIGTLGGFSTAWLCRAVGEKGKLFSCEINPVAAQVAQKNLSHLGFENRVEILTGAASAHLERLSENAPYDFVFIDADKSSYPLYCQWATKVLRKGGILLCDNAYLWGAMNYWKDKKPEELPLAPNKGLHSYTRSQFAAMAECWDYLAPHPELCSLILPTGDGLAISVKVT